MTPTKSSGKNRIMKFICNKLNFTKIAKGLISYYECKKHFLYYDCILIFSIKKITSFKARARRTLQYRGAKIIPLIFLEYFIKYQLIKGLIMFKLHIMRVCEGVLGHSYPFVTLPHLKSLQNHHFYPF